MLNYGLERQFKRHCIHLAWVGIDDRMPEIISLLTRP